MFDEHFAYIFVTGNPVDGFSFAGPFIDKDQDAAHENAVLYGEENGDGDWWIAPIDLKPFDEAGLKKFTRFLTEPVDG